MDPADCLYQVQKEVKRTAAWRKRAFRNSFEQGRAEAQEAAYQKGFEVGRKLMGFERGKEASVYLNKFKPYTRCPLVTQLYLSALLSSGGRGVGAL